MKFCATLVENLRKNLIENCGENLKKIQTFQKMREELETIRKYLREFEKRICDVWYKDCPTSLCATHLALTAQSSAFSMHTIVFCSSRRVNRVHYQLCTMNASQVVKTATHMWYLAKTKNCTGLYCYSPNSGLINTHMRHVPLTCRAVLH